MKQLHKAKMMLLFIFSCYNERFSRFLIFISHSNTHFFSFLPQMAILWRLSLSSGWTQFLSKRHNLKYHNYCMTSTFVLIVLVQYASIENIASVKAFFYSTNSTRVLVRAPAIQIFKDNTCIVILNTISI